MTTARQKRTERQIVQILLAQGAIVTCPLCKDMLRLGDKTIREHMHAIKLGGSDARENEAYVHEDCANLKTNGTKATTYGSDRHAIAKCDRLKKERNGEPKRKPKGRPMPGTRASGLRKRFDGTVERR